MNPPRRVTTEDERGEACGRIESANGAGTERTELRRALQLASTRLAWECEQTTSTELSRGVTDETKRMQCSRPLGPGTRRRRVPQSALEIESTCRFKSLHSD